MNTNDPVTIVGAGPSGLAAAITLARSGRRVVIYEKNADVGMRFHDDFQGLENWTTESDVLDFMRLMSIEIDFFCRPIYGGLLQGPSDRAVVRSPEPLFYLVKRGRGEGTLDRSLKRQAMDCGVRIEFNSPAPEGRGDVIATGPRKPRMFAAGMVFDTGVEDVAAIILDNDIAPKGYAYLLAAEGRATLATVLYSHFERCEHYREKALAAFRKILPFEMKNPTNFSGFGSFFLKRTAHERGQRFVGEAAGFQDFLFGFGIRYALTSGHLAARGIIEDIDYDQLWKLRLSRQLKMSALNRRLYEMFGNVAYTRLVRQTIASGNPRDLWRRFYTGSFRSLLGASGREEPACDASVRSGL